ncbi:glycosyltransferase family 2 protein [Photobacterium sp. TY1-4]|uniref:glycosyltransferase family 2 protein n=1 Tax=Photobacterium sp. TY1-4 TaxID=2899122 RepID=UPI0021BEC1B5|nr:glycosyltransferase family 2 protein [Photobacterium sp. TY1-4]UXI01448.1 glycosyltransferase family 2 protein [Photobacterium sp. TY1-4]
MSTQKPTLAVALIVKNEADNLQACLASVSGWVDEIIVLDSGSTDHTEAVARQYTDKFYVNAEWPGFGPQRRLAQSYVTADYVLWLDADERVTPELRASIEQTLANPQANTVYSIARLSWVFGRYIRHCGWYPDRVNRLYPTALTQYNEDLVHEKVELNESMQVAKLDGDLLHFTYNDLHHYLVKSAGYAKAWAEQREKRGKRSSISQGLLHALGCFLKMYVIKAGFLDGKQGLLLSILSAHSTFVKYADLWIRTSTAPPKSPLE